MGNKATSPFPTYEAAINHLNPMEINHLKKNFKAMSRGHDTTINLNNFVQTCVVKAPSAPYIRKHILPRLFAAMDSKKDNVIDFEEYVCAVALFRVGSTEEKIRVLFMMYDPVKGIHLMKQNLRKMLVDSTIAIQKDEVPVLTLENWVADQTELSECMAEMALQQFAAQEGKLEIQEFVSFVKVEGSLQGLLLILPDAIDI